ncbi:MAG TPA: PTS sugar transporter subunit IIA [Patescibacteria group bacterium]|nr:PTS sugar transporter subunit IIA [Patescibacteria group bacterium]
MRLIDYMDRKLVFLDVEAQAKEEAITEIVRRMKVSQAIRDESYLLEEIFSRESRGGTSLGNGVAIPHARVKFMDKIVIAMARLSSGVSFCQEDRQPVRIVFILITPQDKLNEYLKVLAALSKFLKDKKLLKRLFAVDSVQSAWELFESLEPRDE